MMNGVEVWWILHSLRRNSLLRVTGVKSQKNYKDPSPLRRSNQESGESILLNGACCMKKSDPCLFNALRVNGSVVYVCVTVRPRRLLP